MTQQTKSPTLSSLNIDRRITLMLAVLTLAGYLRTLAPGLLAGDPGEFQFAAWNFGLAHPTGYPLYMVLGGAWQHLLSPLASLGVSPATSLNAFSAVCAALAVAMLYRLMLGWLPGTPTARRMGALLTATLFAANPTFWNQSLLAEVYALHALFVVLIFWSTTKSTKVGGRPPVLPIFLALLALTHHATSLLLLPGLIVYLARQDRDWWSAWQVWAAMLLGAALVAFCYLYIPLRAGATASPWYHQDLGGQVLDLYGGGGDAFVQFISGRSISVGFQGAGAAVEEIRFAASQWRINFSLPGLALVLGGLAMLFRARNWSVLALTGLFALLQQGFNLFYAIDDIHVYYIPLYLVGAIWAGFGMVALAVGGERVLAAQGDAESTTATTPDTPATDTPATDTPATDTVEGTETEATNRPAITPGMALAVLLFFIPINLVRTYLPQVDQSGATGARLRWEEILAAGPPDDAILISNDRNEIVPLFYLQYVEDRVPGLAGLFPLIAPEERFADVGATVDTALTVGGGRPVYLIKPMEGLEVRFDIEARTPPLYQVTGDAATAPPEVSIEGPADAALGPLTLVGYDVEESTDAPDTLHIWLHWRVDGPLAADYTGTLQLYDAAQQRIAQDDRQPGGAYYPTSHWKVGETQVVEHELSLPPDSAPAHLLVGMYLPPGMELLAPPLELPWVE